MSTFHALNCYVCHVLILLTSLTSWRSESCEDGQLQSLSPPPAVIHVIKRLMVNYNIPRQYLNTYILTRQVCDIRVRSSSRDLKSWSV